MGVVVSGSHATIEASVVRDAKTDEKGTFGDGIAMLLGAATIQNATVSGDARAGVANWGPQVTILDAPLTCNAFALNGEQRRRGPRLLRRQPRLAVPPSPRRRGLRRDDRPHRR